MLATGAVNRLERRSRPVNAPLSPAFDSVNAFLQFYFTKLESRRFLRVSHTLSIAGEANHGGLEQESIAQAA